MLTRHVDMEEGTGDGQADDYAIWALLLLVLLKCRTGGFSVAKHIPPLFFFHNCFHDLITGIVVVIYSLHGFFKSTTVMLVSN